MKHSHSTGKTWSLYFLSLFWLQVVETSSGQKRLKGSKEELNTRTWKGQGHNQWQFMATVQGMDITSPDSLDLETYWPSLGQLSTPRPALAREAGHRVQTLLLGVTPGYLLGSTIGISLFRIFLSSWTSPFESLWVETQSYLFLGTLWTQVFPKSRILYLSVTLISHGPIWLWQKKLRTE